MRKNLLLIFGIIFSISICAQTNIEYKTTNSISGCPKDIEPLQKQFGLQNFAYSNLETGVDSIKIVFGTMTQGKTNGYWIASYFNDKLTTFALVPLFKENSSEYYSNDIDIKFDNSSKKISLSVKHNPSQNEILYLWWNGNGKNELTIQKVNKLLQKKKPLPVLNLTTLTDQSISSTDFKGKILVINWWATTCAPCRKEIPGLNKLVDKYEKNQNVAFLAIAFDKKDRLENYFKANQFKYIQTIGDINISKIFGESYPKNLIVNPDGVITFYSEGGHENTYLKIEEELLKQIN